LPIGRQNRKIESRIHEITQSPNIHKIGRSAIVNVESPLVAAPEQPTAIGRYEVVSRLGQGGMGSLYLAKDPKIGRLVAIKLVRQEFDSPEARQRFAREAQSAGTLRHPNIVTIFDVDEHDGLPFIAMEYIDGETLGEIVKRKALLPIARRIQWVEDLCNGLAYAHRQGVIHRDIKPANLMVDTEGSLKILDFGLARRDASKFTQSHVIIGTPNYMSPEQIRGQNLDTRSDIFSVGALFYEVLAYKEAFPGAVHQTMHKILHEEPEPLDGILPGLDPGIQKILSRAMQKDRDARYADLTAMKADLTEVRLRLENVATDATTLPLGRDARFGAGPGTTPARGTTPLSTPGSRTGSSQASKRFQTNRQSLQKRRSESITAALDEARKLFEAGDLEKSRNKCDEALMLDPDHPGALQLMDDIGAEADRQQVAQFIAEARAELQKGQLDRAEAIVAQARQMAPESTDVQQLQAAIDTTRREIERTRQMQETMRRARQRFAEGGFEAALRAVGEVLAIDPENASAKDLQTRAQEAIEAQATRAERDKAAQSAVASARKLFESGDGPGAIAQLEAFTPKHDLVSAFLATLKGEKVPEPEFASAGAGGETAHILRQARGPTEDLPARRNMLIAVGAFSVILLGAMAIYRPWESAPTAVDALANNASPSFDNLNAAAAPPPVLTPPVVTAPPVAATDVNGPDVTKAYDAITNGRVDDAARILGAIRRRDPQYAGLKPLQAAIDNQRAFEEKQKQQQAAAAAAALAAANPPPAPAKPLSDPEPPAAPAKEVIATVLPGGGFAATSEPISPLTAGQAARPEIEAAVAEWARALGTMNLRTISNIRAFTPTEVKNWQTITDNYSAMQVTARLLSDPEVRDDIATVPVREVRVMTQKRGGIRITQTYDNTYRLQKVGDKWLLRTPS
jgi:serine/threonine protein kinase